MFDTYGLERIRAWREFRNSLETSDNPLRDVAELWASAPFVNNYLVDYRPDEWPDPWQLILETDLDDLAIALGMCYSIKLTKRFSTAVCEIHKSAHDKKDERYFLSVDREHVLNLEYRDVAEYRAIEDYNPYLLWTCPLLR